MKKQNGYEEHQSISNPADAVDAIVGYFTGQTCRGCAFGALEYLLGTLQRHEAAERLAERRQETRRFLDS
jgi:hypothetical protein